MNKAERDLLKARHEADQSRAAAAEAMEVCHIAFHSGNEQAVLAATTQLAAASWRHGWDEAVAMIMEMHVPAKKSKRR